MDLKNNQITVGELLNIPKARQILNRRFPALAASPAILVAKSWTVTQVLQFAKGKVPDKDIQAALRDLQQL